MVVVCESCETRFQLDESRIPPKGTLVRCSRCKSTFIVKPPEVGFEETVQDIVSEVAEAGGTPVPPAAEDLFETTSGDLGTTLQSPEDDAWEFDEDAEPEPEVEAPARAAAPAFEPEPHAFEAPEPAKAESPDTSEDLEPVAPPEGLEEPESPAAPEAFERLDSPSPSETFERLDPPSPSETFERLDSPSPSDFDSAADSASAPERDSTVPPARDSTIPPALDDLGHPDDWDLLGDSVNEAASGATFLDAEPATTDGFDSLAPAADARDSDAESASAELDLEDRAAAELEADLALDGEAPSEEASAMRLRLEGAGRSLLGVGQTALRAAGWVAVLAAIGLGARAVVPEGPQAVPLATRQELLPLADGEARGVRVRFVENAFAGTLYVVEGELVRLDAQPSLGLRVRWRDAAGTPIGEPQWAQPLPADRDLRERAPEALQAAQGPGWVAPARGRFAAIFPALPEGAVGVTLALEALPARSVGAAGPDVSESDPEDPAADAATTPSPPTAPPSTE